MYTQGGPQLERTLGEERDGVLQPPSGLQSECESLDPVQKISWRLVHMFGSQKNTRHPSRKVARFKRLLKELRELRKLAQYVRLGGKFLVGCPQGKVHKRSTFHAPM